MYGVKNPYRVPPTSMFVHYDARTSVEVLCRLPELGAVAIDDVAVASPAERGVDLIVGRAGSFADTAGVPLTSAGREER